MARFVDLVDRIEHETLRRFSDLRDRLDHPEQLEGDTRKSLNVLRDALSGIEGEYEEPITAAEALSSIAGSYLHICYDLGQTTRRYGYMRNESDYVEGIRLLTLVAESDAILVLASIKRLNEVYFGVPNLTEYLDRHVELVKESKRILMDDELRAPIKG